MRAFGAHQRPQGPQPRQGAAGDELVSLSGGAYGLRAHERPALSAPSGVYNFVRVQGMTRNQSTTMLSAQAPHAALANGRSVLYAGTAAFDGGKLQWWSNYSGTYQPLAEFNRQAGLPTDRFVPWQKLQLGGIGMQRGMLHDLRGSRSEPEPEKETRKPVVAIPPAGAKAAAPAPEKK